MLKAIGLTTNKTYASGKTKADVMRSLQIMFPYTQPEETRIRVGARDVYPEVIKIF